jgi:hypothetical protein
MTYTDVLRHFGPFGYFELPNLLTLTQERRGSLLSKLHRWSKQGDIIQLKRGFYAIPEAIAKNPLTPERAANQLYKFSYVTGLWRLNQIGLIPEGVVEVTNATLNNPAEFNTFLGRFTYQHVSVAGFFGYELVEDGVLQIKVATAEKALLDFFWWKRIEWTAEEFERWRIQDPWKKIDHDRLHAFAKRWGPTRLKRAAANLTQYLK